MPSDLILEGSLILVVFLRMIGFTVSAPFFSGQYMNTYMKIGFSFLMAIIIRTSMPGLILSDTIFTNVYAFALVAIIEIVIGLSIGFISTVVMNAIVFAGALIDSQASLTMAGQLDPLSSTQMPITANLYYYGLIAVFLITNSHHMFIKAAVDSFAVLPLGTLNLSGLDMNFFIRLMADFFIIGFKFASPIIATMLILDVGLGILVRTVPQMNMFVVGFPLKIATYLLVLLVVTNLMVNNYGYLIDRALQTMYGIVRMFEGAG